MKIIIEQPTEHNAETITISLNPAQISQPTTETTTNYTTQPTTAEPTKQTPLITNLNHITWKEISTIAQSGTAPQWFALGATKDITLTTNEHITVRIIGFNHDTDTAGNILPLTWNMTHLLSAQKTINIDCSSPENHSSWKNSGLRSQLNHDILATLPQDLRDIIKPAQKATFNPAAGKIEQTTDHLWLLSEKERFGREIYSGKAPDHWYAYYRQENISWGKKFRKIATTSYLEWQRSPHQTAIDYFCCVAPNGVPLYSQTYIANGISFAFCI